MSSACVTQIGYATGHLQTATETGRTPRHGSGRSGDPGGLSPGAASADAGGVSTGAGQLAGRLRYGTAPLAQTVADCQTSVIPGMDHRWAAGAGVDRARPVYEVLESQARQ